MRSSTFAVSLVSVLGATPLPAQECLERVPVVELSKETAAVVHAFAVGLKQFQGLSFEEFLTEFGPSSDFSRPEAERFLRGDSNGDGTVDISDASCMLARLFLGGDCTTGTCDDRRDSDDNGVLDIADPIFLLNFLFRGGEVLPAPHGTAGVDPTADDLACGASALGYDPFKAEYLDAILGSYPIDAAQEEALRENGFVSLAGRRHETFFHALNDIFERHLPVYISADLMLDALHLSFDAMLQTIEERYLIGELDTLLKKLDAAIANLAAAAGDALAQELDDVAVWVCSARSLLAGNPVSCSRGVDARVAEFLALVAAEQIGVRVEVFGQQRLEDFSQFRPRGHYTKTEELKRYFRAMMWVQRMGLDFAQCPRHAAVAHLLSSGLVEGGALTQWQHINETLEAIVGLSDSVNAPGYLDFAQTAGIGSAADYKSPGTFLNFVTSALTEGLGAQQINSQILQANPVSGQPFTPFPPAFHLMGQRFIVDSFVFGNVVHDRVNNRSLPSPLDALFVLGNRNTVPLLTEEIRAFGYHSHLATLDYLVNEYPESFWNDNLYNVWLTALRDLNQDTTEARYPTVMRTKTWARHILNTQLASWAHLRHDTILYAKQSTTLGCDYPDGWVDPYPEFYRTLAEFSDVARARFEAIGLLKVAGLEGIAPYLASLRAHSLELAGIAENEVAGLPLEASQMAFIRNALAKKEENAICTIITAYDGWYPDLVFGTSFSGEDHPDFAPTIADVHTDPGPPAILHVGVGYPDLTVLTVQTDCSVKSYTGPTLSYHETVRSKRMNDEEWAAELEAGGSARPGWTWDFAR